MRKRKEIAVVLVLSMLAYLLAGFGSAAVFAETMFAAETPFEAEAGTLSGKMEKTKDAAASGGYFISVAEGERVDEPGTMQPEASYTFTVPADGEYEFWTKSHMKDDGADSFWARFDEEAYVYCGGKVSDGYTWKSHFTQQLTKGRHTLDLVHRENNTKFDMICITTDPDKSIGAEAGATSAPEVAPTAPAGLADAQLVEIGETGSALFEAEDMTINEELASVGDNAAASGKRAVTFIKDAKEQMEAELPGAISFRLKAARGSYKIWMRYAAATDGNDSAYKSLNGAEYSSQPFSVTGSKENFAWTLVGSVKFVGEEEQTVRLRPRESGGIIDQFVVIKSATYVPEGLLSEAPEVGAETVQPLPSDAYPAPTITPPPEHPRLLFRASDIPTIKENMEKAQSENAIAKWQGFLSQETDGMLDAPKDTSSGNYNTSVLAIIESKAFDYAINGNRENGQKAVDAILNVLETSVFAPGAQDVTRPMGHTIFTASEVYDWCYDLLTDEQKKHIVILCQEIAHQMEIGWPPNKQGAVVGHGGETQLQRDLLSFGVATYDEYPDIYNYVAGRFLSEYLEPRNYWYQSHSYHQGYSYNNCRYNSDLWGQWIIYRMSGEKIFTDDARYPMYYTEYARRPDGAVFAEGDMDPDRIGVEPTYFTNLQPLFFAAGFYSDPYLKYQTAIQSGGYNSFNYSFTTLTPVQFLLFNDPDTDVRPFSELPNTAYFGSPNGTMIARTGWEMGIESPVAMAYMRIGERWAANHHHLDAGTFQLYYKGMLAFNPGRYDAYGTEHDYNFNKETISHNGLLIYDPNETMPNNVVNSGGQKRLNVGEPATFDIWMDDDKYKMGEVLGQEAGPDALRPEYSYISGDVADAYSDKVSEVRRSMAFFDNDNADIPALFFVMDKVTSTDKSFKKTFLLHSMQEPEVNGNTTTIKRDTDGYNGKLVNQTLYPQDAKIEKVGGPGKQWLVNGKNYVPNGADEQSTDLGWGRIEISPAAENETDYFLNAMYMTDADKTVEAQAELIETDLLLGAKLDGTVALFVKDKARAQSDLTFTIPGDGEYRILVAGIAAGGWSISKDGVPLDMQIATEEGGVIYLNGGAGSYTLSYTDPSAQREPQELVIPEHEGITVKIDSKYMYTDVAPVLQNDRTMVPMRAIFENLGAEITWDEATETVTGIKDDVTVTLKIGDPAAYVNGREVTLDAPAILHDDRTLVPIRFVSEALGAKVDWEEASRTVFITPAKEYKPLSPYAVQIIDCEWSSDNGEFQNGYKAYDGDAETRWAAEGVGEWIIFELKEEADIASYYTQFYNGASRVYSYDLYASTDGVNYTLFLSTQTKGEGDVEEIKLDKPVRAKYIKMVGKANTVNGWNSLHEIEFRTQ